MRKHGISGNLKIIFGFSVNSVITIIPFLPFRKKDSKWKKDGENNILNPWRLFPWVFTIRFSVKILSFLTDFWWWEVLLWEKILSVCCFAQKTSVFSSKIPIFEHSYPISPTSDLVFAVSCALMNFNILRKSPLCTWTTDNHIRILCRWNWRGKSFYSRRRSYPAEWNANAVWWNRAWLEFQDIPKPADRSDEGSCMRLPPSSKSMHWRRIFRWADFPIPYPF